MQDALNRSKAAVASGASRRQRLVLAEELLAIQKLVHRLGEEADDTNVKGLERDRTSTKRLLLVAQGCEGLNFVMAALQNFVETEDQAFLGFATDGNSIVLNIRKLL